MTSDDKYQLLAAQYQRKIVDPYPELADWENFQQMRRDCRKYCYIGDRPKPEISPHKAWQDGFDFAWKLITERIEQIDVRSKLPAGEEYYP